MSLEMVNFIGEYQLGNLISNEIPFLYIYVQEDEDDTVADHPLTQRIMPRPFLGLVEFVSEKAPNQEYPVVLICKNGRQSFEAATHLMVAGHKNVFVVEGGIGELF